MSSFHLWCRLSALEDSELLSIFSRDGDVHWAMTTASATEAPQATAIKQSSFPTCFTKASRENNLATTQQPERTVKATAVEEAGARVSILVALPVTGS